MLSRLAVNHLVNSSFHPCQVKSVHADGKGQECRQHGRKVAGAKHSRHLLWKAAVHHGTVVNTFVLANRVLKITSRKEEEILQPLIQDHISMPGKEYPLI